MDYMCEFFHVESSEYIFPKSLYFQARCKKKPIKPQNRNWSILLFSVHNIKKII